MCVCMSATQLPSSTTIQTRSYGASTTLFYMHFYCVYVYNRGTENWEAKTVCNRIFVYLMCMRWLHFRLSTKCKKNTHTTFPEKPNPSPRLVFASVAFFRFVLLWRTRKWAKTKCMARLRRGSSGRSTHGQRRKICNIDYSNALQSTNAMQLALIQ